MDETLRLVMVAWIAINAGFLFGALWASRDKLRLPRLRTRFSAR
jgi:hypothetical protein